MSDCSKLRYATKAEAKAAKRDCQRAHDHGASWRRENRIYRCPLCRSWHLTSTPLRSDRA